MHTIIDDYLLYTRRHLNERLEFGMETRARLAYSYVTSKETNTLIPCRTVTVDFGLQTIDPGLTPNGASCGDGRMCVDQRCRPLEALWLEGVGPQCAGNCSGHGVCDNTGSCHCEVGFGGERCDEAGPGGSRNSGPATNPNGEFDLGIYFRCFSNIILNQSIVQ